MEGWEGIRDEVVVTWGEREKEDDGDLPRNARGDGPNLRGCMASLCQSIWRPRLLSTSRNQPGSSSRSPYGRRPCNRVRGGRF